MIFGLILTNLMYAMRGWLECNKFTDFFYFSPLDLQLRIIESVNNDSGIPLFLVRAFHNKLSGGAIDIFRSYTLYWDIRLLMSLIGLTGFFFFLFGVYQFLQQNRQKYLWGVFVLLFLWPFMAIFRILIPFHLWLLVYSGFFLCFALYGVLQSNKAKSKVFIPSAIGSFLLGIWWSTVYTPQLLDFCMR